MNPVQTALLRRTRSVYLEAGNHPPSKNAELMAGLEAHLSINSFVLSRRLRSALETQPPSELKKWAKSLTVHLAQSFGDMSYAFPQFKNFPDGVPRNTHELFQQRILAYLFQQPEQPCVLCGKDGTVHAVKPCAHLVCRECWDGGTYSGCPICHRKIAWNDPFLKPALPKQSFYAATYKLRLLDLGKDLKTDAQNLFTRLCKRVSPLAPIDMQDLKAVIKTYQASVIPWMPERIPVKETMATLLGDLLKMQNPSPAVYAAIRQRVRTATDILRILMAYWGGDPALVAKLKKFPSLTRSMRVEVMTILEGLDPILLAEDIRRWAGLWRRIAEVLHPFEYLKRFPNTCAAFAAVRGTTVTPGTPLGDLLSTYLTRFPQNYKLKAGRLRFQGWQAQVEAQLEKQDIDQVLTLLRQRPGEFSRRLNHLLLRALDKGEQALNQSIDRFKAALPQMSPAILLVLMAHFKHRHAPFPKRVFFPKGLVLKAWAIKDLRRTLPPSLCKILVEAIEQELLRRAAEADPLQEAVIDLQLKALPLPFNERTTARVLVALPRGSFVPLVPAAFYRLFCHWTEASGQRADLDLSVSFFDDKWQFVDLCDYTNLTAMGGAAIHSGDYTSAPEPDGAAEYVDLDLKKLKAHSVRYAFMTVFSFNAIPFDRLQGANAGMMARENNSGEVFEPRAVSQRFDLGGDAMVFCPLLVDIEEGKLLWLDTNMAEAGQFHRVWEYKEKLSFLGRDFKNYFLHGSRPSIWDASCLIAAARSKQVFVRDAQGQYGLVERTADENVLDFYHRLLTYQGQGKQAEPQLHAPVFASLYQADLPLPLGSTFYSLYFDDLPAEQQQARWNASDLPTAFANKKK